MSIVLQTIQFNLLGKPYEISLWLDGQEMGSLEAVGGKLSKPVCVNTSFVFSPSSNNEKITSDSPGKSPYCQLCAKILLSSTRVTCKAFW